MQQLQFTLENMNTQGELESIKTNSKKKNKRREEEEVLRPIKLLLMYIAANKQEINYNDTN